MKAILYKKYGSPNVIQYIERNRPVPKEDEVLIQVKATTLSPSDIAFRSGKPFLIRFFDGLVKPKSIPGDAFSGDVVEVGKSVRSLKMGDRVYGTTAPSNGTHAEFVTISEKGAIAKVPDTMTYGEAASLADGAITALPFLRDNGQLREKQTVLINGASGSVGSYAVQLAKNYGAEVTGVCSTANLELVKKLGADYVIDYTKKDFTEKT
ncbi:NAD(P)-dependent alcohol dehydrogenase [Pontibacillus yanchengensis]|uniref:NAD(P)-dependent alcohol dehydrogenase n=1 Tax=Pontibacillus yanchengensis TaxID=462910 RepID=UPI000689867B|nr:NAD(P)-dependent alcohol dehydrogenase [Pontibacillus yanchengensis]